MKTHSHTSLTPFEQAILPRPSQARQTRRRHRLLAGVALLSLLLTAAGFWGLLRGRGVVVTVKNLGPQTLHQCYLANDAPLRHGFLGDIPPGGTASARIRPTREGGLTVCYSAENGSAKSLYAGIYWDQRPRGRASLAVQNSKIAAADYTPAHSGVILWFIDYVFDDLISQMSLFD